MKRPRDESGDVDTPQQFVAHGAGSGVGAGATMTAAPATTMRISGLDRDDRATEREILVFFNLPGEDFANVDATVHALVSVDKMVDREETAKAKRAVKFLPTQICHKCGNTDPSKFFDDTHAGEVICQSCAAVVVQRSVHDGEMYRKFEGEEDRSHHGPAMDKMFSMSHNLRTSMAGGSYAKSRQLQNIQDQLELNLSNMNRDERRTRQGYKEKMKHQAFGRITQAARRLDLGEVLIADAKRMFARYRDDQEQVHGFERVVACCLIAAYRGLREAGRLVSRSQELARAKLKNRQGFPCHLCKTYFRTRMRRDKHKCAKMTAEQLKERDDRLKARDELEARKKRATEGSLMKIPGE